jgi:hypothetical protein
MPIIGCLRIALCAVPRLVRHVQHAHELKAQTVYAIEYAEEVRLVFHRPLRTVRPFAASISIPSKAAAYRALSSPRTTTWDTFLVLLRVLCLPPLSTCSERTLQKDRLSSSIGASPLGDLWGCEEG